MIIIGTFVETDLSMTIELSDKGLPKDPSLYCDICYEYLPSEYQMQVCNNFLHSY